MGRKRRMREQLEAAAQLSRVNRQLVFEEPVFEEPVFEEPVFEEPVFEEPVFEEPVFEEPAFEEPAFEEPVFEEPVFEEPVFEEPVFEEPVFEEPVFEKPAFEVPVFEELGFQEPAFQKQVSHESSQVVKFDNETNAFAPRSEQRSSSQKLSKATKNEKASASSVKKKKKKEKKKKKKKRTKNHRAEAQCPPAPTTLQPETEAIRDVLLYRKDSTRSRKKESIIESNVVQSMSDSNSVAPASKTSARGENYTQAEPVNESWRDNTKSVFLSDLTEPSDFSIKWLVNRPLILGKCEEVEVLYSPVSTTEKKETNSRGLTETVNLLAEDRGRIGERTSALKFNNFEDEECYDNPKTPEHDYRKNEAYIRPPWQDFDDDRMSLDDEDEIQPSKPPTPGKNFLPISMFLPKVPIPDSPEYYYTPAVKELHTKERENQTRERTKRPSEDSDENEYQNRNRFSKTRKFVHGKEDKISATSHFNDGSRKLTRNLQQNSEHHQPEREPYGNRRRNNRKRTAARKRQNEHLVQPGRCPVKSVLGDLRLRENGFVDHYHHRVAMTTHHLEDNYIECAERKHVHDTENFFVEGAGAVYSENVDAGCAHAVNTGNLDAVGALAVNNGYFDTGGAPTVNTGYFDAGGAPAINTGSFDAGSAPAINTGSFDAGSAPAINTGYFDTGGAPAVNNQYRKKTYASTLAAKNYSSHQFPADGRKKRILDNGSSTEESVQIIFSTDVCIESTRIVCEKQENGLKSSYGFQHSSCQMQVQEESESEDNDYIPRAPLTPGRGLEVTKGSIFFAQPSGSSSFCPNVSEPQTYLPYYASRDLSELHTLPFVDTNYLIDKVLKSSDDHSFPFYDPYEDQEVIDVDDSILRSEIIIPDAFEPEVGFAFDHSLLLDRSADENELSSPRGSLVLSSVSGISYSHYAGYLNKQNYYSSYCDQGSFCDRKILDLNEDPNNYVIRHSVASQDTLNKCSNIEEGYCGFDTRQMPIFCVTSARNSSHDSDGWFRAHLDDSVPNISSEPLIDSLSDLRAQERQETENFLRSSRSENSLRTKKDENRLGERHSFSNGNCTPAFTSVNLLPPEPCKLHSKSEKMRKNRDDESVCLSLPHRSNVMDASSSKSKSKWMKDDKFHSKDENELGETEEHPCLKSECDLIKLPTLLTGILIEPENIENTCPSPTESKKLSTKIPERSRRQLVEAESLANFPNSGPHPDREFIAGEFESFPSLTSEAPNLSAVNASPTSTLAPTRILMSDRCAQEAHSTSSFLSVFKVSIAGEISSDKSNEDLNLISRFENYSSVHRSPNEELNDSFSVETGVLYYQEQHLESRIQPKCFDVHRPNSMEKKCKQSVSSNPGSICNNQSPDASPTRFNTSQQNSCTRSSVSSNQSSQIQEEPSNEFIIQSINQSHPSFPQELSSSASTPTYQRFFSENFKPLPKIKASEQYSGFSQRLSSTHDLMDEFLIHENSILNDGSCSLECHALIQECDTLNTDQDTVHANYTEQLEHRLPLQKTNDQRENEQQEGGPKASWKRMLESLEGEYKCSFQASYRELPANCSHNSEFVSTGNFRNERCRKIRREDSSSLSLPEQNSSPTPDQNTPATPDQNTPATPDQNTPATPDQNTPALLYTSRCV
ncbi:uncharacterized protein LOC125178031 [Hyalella azteca]|uniref:Uncharacterized protein LOC125178031 n=1 Tax=Hyalella azteca TaxID=294128 RepID=A0A979FIQ8_HYAAZ|nr:uncharacterized protein LOC125178031 [Hyalella azteca]